MSRSYRPTSYRHLYDMMLIQKEIHKGEVIALMVALGLNEPYNPKAVMKAGAEIRRLQALARLVPTSVESAESADKP